MSSAANLDTNTTGSGPERKRAGMQHWAKSTQRKLGSLGAIPHVDDDQRYRASLTLADRAVDAAELLDWLDMFGLPPCERRLRSYNPKYRPGEGSGT